MEAVRAGMSSVCVDHGQDSGGPIIRDIHLDSFNVSVGERDLIADGSVTLSYGRHYGMLFPSHFTVRGVLFCILLIFFIFHFLLEMKKNSLPYESKSM